MGKDVERKVTRARRDLWQLLLAGALFASALLLNAIVTSYHDAELEQLSESIRAIEVELDAKHELMRRMRQWQVLHDNEVWREDLMETR